MKQLIFLTNTHTKSVKHADIIADVLIIETAHNYQRTPTDKIINFLKTGKPQTMQTKIYSPQI